MNLKYLAQVCGLYHFFMNTGGVVTANEMLVRLGKGEHANSVLQYYQNLADNYVDALADNMDEE